MIIISKSEMITYILTEAKKVSKTKNQKKLKRYLGMAKLQLIKSTDKEVENLYKRVKKEGAEKVFSDD